MLPEGEDLNEWIAVNSKSWERGTCPSAERNPRTSGVYPQQSLGQLSQATGVRLKEGLSCATQIHRVLEVLSLFHLAAFPCSGGFLQPDQHALRDHHRVLHGEQLPCHVRRTTVRHGLLQQA